MSKFHFTTAPNNLALHTGDEVESVRLNRLALSAQLQCDNIQFMNQSHGDGVKVVSEYSDVDPDADALITQTPGIALAVLVADCIPLLLSSATCVAAVHVGRMGMTNGIIEKTVEIMEELGATGISAQIGPSICGECYEVSPQMYDEVTAVFPESATSEISHCLDLTRGTLAILRELGVDAQSLGLCTLENEKYFSYRRDKSIGRQAGVITL